MSHPVGGELHHLEGVYEPTCPHSSAISTVRSEMQKGLADGTTDLHRWTLIIPDRYSSAPKVNLAMTDYIIGCQE